MTSVAAVPMPLDQLIEIADGGAQVRALPFVDEEPPDCSQPVGVDDGPFDLGFDPYDQFDFVFRT